MQHKGRKLLVLLSLMSAVLLTSQANLVLAENGSQEEQTLNELPDTYTHATVSDRKELLEGEDYEKALQFLADSSHYLYVHRATPYYGNLEEFPETGFDTEWRSPINDRVYRGPYGDPLTRSVQWMAMSPNGAINSSIGSYWAAVPPNTELELENNELQGYEVKDKWQIVSYLGPGQTAENYIRTGRGSVYVDASLVSEYDVPAAWEDRNVLNLELKLDHYVRREVTPEQFYDGLLPTTAVYKVDPAWQLLPGWDESAGDDRFRTIQQFWGSATGDAAEFNLTTDEERAVYLERAEEDQAVREILNSVVIDLYFDVEQIVNVKQQIGLDFEHANGKVNGIDKDGDGFLDRYPEGHEQEGEVILLNAYERASLPDWAYDLNFNDGWWMVGGNIVDAEGNIVTGANEDGSFIYEDETASE